MKTENFLKALYADVCFWFALSPSVCPIVMRGTLFGRLVSIFVEKVDPHYHAV